MAFFDYSNTPTGDWAPYLTELKQGSIEGVVVRVFWGDHESLKGVRDFHSKSRLKLEKLCSLAHSIQVPLHFRFGFTEDPRSFPTWTHTLTPQAFVPTQVEQELISPWEFLRVPSFRNEEVRKGFLGFLAEALSLLSLHRAPEGSAQTVSFDPGILLADSCPMDQSFIESELSQRYQSIERLNGLFQTSFNSFQSVSKPAGLKTLLSKRPWVACWDYKNLKSKAIQIWEDEIKAVFKENQFEWISPGASDFELHLGNSIALDDTFLEALGGLKGFSPLIIQGEVDPNVLAAFRLAEMLRLEAAFQGQPIVGLSSWTPSSKSRVCVVVCSKFISRKSYSALCQFIEIGGRVVFPFAAPKWDENLDSLQWNPKAISQQGWEVDEKLFEKMSGCFL